MATYQRVNEQSFSVCKTTLEFQRWTSLHWNSIQWNKFDATSSEKEKRKQNKKKMLPYFSCAAKFLQAATFTFGWKLHDYLFIYLFVTFGAMLFRFSHDHQVIRVISMICSIEREREQVQLSCCSWVHMNVDMDRVDNPFLKTCPK